MSDNVKTSKLNSILISVVILLLTGIGSYVYAKLEKVDTIASGSAAVSVKLDGLKETTDSLQTSQAAMWSKVVPRSEFDLQILSLKKDMEAIKTDNNDIRLQQIKTQLDVAKLQSSGK